MSDKDFIKGQQAKLLEEKKRIESELNSIARPSKGNPEDFNTRYENIGDDIDENAMEVYTYEQNLATEHRLEDILHKINGALDKIAKGKYGECDKGDQIEIERLKVIPWAATCIKHSK